MHLSKWFRKPESHRAQLDRLEETLTDLQHQVARLHVRLDLVLTVPKSVSAQRKRSLDAHLGEQ